jgi:hypothetical protein
MKQLKKISEFKHGLIEKKELEFFNGGTSGPAATSRTEEFQTGQAGGPAGCDCGIRLDGFLVITRDSGTVSCE